MKQYRSPEDQLFGPAFAALETLLAAPQPLGEHPAYHQLQAYLANSLDEEQVSAVSLHVLTCESCHQEVRDQRLRCAKPMLRRVRLDRQAALLYALAIFVVLIGFSWAWFTDQSILEVAQTPWRGGPRPIPM